jgi:biopolymer transport protein ExbB/TolQ
MRNVTILATLFLNFASLHAVETDAKTVIPVAPKAVEAPAIAKKMEEAKPQTPAAMEVPKLKTETAAKVKPEETKPQVALETPKKAETAISVLAPVAKKSKISLDLQKVFFTSPIIYSLLLLMSVSSLVIWLYSLVTCRTKEILPELFLTKVKNHLREKNYEEAHNVCKNENHYLSRILACGLQSRVHGSEVMIDAMKSEGKRTSASVWQRLSLLNDIIVTAPMLGLLGTVIGMFYAFYDVNRSTESITALFDGLGIAVGTTVAGLIVSIMAMIFHTTLKYRLVKTLSLVETEALSLSSLIETKKA